MARDLGGGDPERMAPPKFAQHLVDLFAKSKNIKISVNSDQKQLEQIYPLFGAVNRAASGTDNNFCISRNNFTVEAVPNFD